MLTATEIVKVNVAEEKQLASDGQHCKGVRLCSCGTPSGGKMSSKVYPQALRNVQCQRMRWHAVPTTHRRPSAAQNQAKQRQDQLLSALA